MSVTITFYNTKEKLPQHGQEIIYLRRVSCFDQYGFEPTTEQVVYTWIGVDEDGEWDGNGAGYDPDTEGGYNIGDTLKVTDSDGECIWKLVMEVDGYVFDGKKDSFLWVDLETYWSCFEKELAS